MCTLALSGELWLDPLREAAIAGGDLALQLRLAHLVHTTLFALTGCAHIVAYRSPGPPPIVRGERYAAPPGWEVVKREERESC